MCQALSVKKPIQTNLRTDPASVPILMKFTYEAPKNRLENIENYIQQRLENQGILKMIKKKISRTMNQLNN
jgi:hypothetical protein